MDLVAEIRKKALAFQSDLGTDGIQAIIRHIERAEKHLRQGRLEGDDDAFNDVIYRTNQAFEGALKEAYRVLTETDGSQLSTHKIEKHLLEKQVLVPRVLNLFTNYRQQWRNPATHDHRLFFGDQEAFLAIVSVSAFVSVLLDQMVEAIHFKREKREAAKQREAIHAELGDYSTASFPQQVAKLLLKFSSEVALPSLNEIRSELELLGQLGGFISSVDPEIQIFREPAMAGDRFLRPDLLLQKGGEKVVVEVKRKAGSSQLLEAGVRQVTSYLVAGKLKEGFVFAPGEGREEMRIVTREIEAKGTILKVHVVMGLTAGIRKPL